MAASIDKTANLLSEMSLTDSEKPSVQFTQQLAKKENNEAAQIRMEEPILKPNPRRFVLFPIKYHEVCNGLRFKDANSLVLSRAKRVDVIFGSPTLTNVIVVYSYSFRSGNSTRRLKLPSGLLKRLTFPRIRMIGTIA